MWKFRVLQQIVPLRLDIVPRLAAFVLWLISVCCNVSPALYTGAVVYWQLLLRQAQHMARCTGWPIRWDLSVTMVVTQPFSSDIHRIPSSVSRRLLHTVQLHGLSCGVTSRVVLSSFPHLPLVVHVPQPCPGVESVPGKAEATLCLDMEKCELQRTENKWVTPTLTENIAHLAQPDK